MTEYLQTLTRSCLSSTLCLVQMLACYTEMANMILRLSTASPAALIALDSQCFFNVSRPKCTASIC